MRCPIAFTSAALLRTAVDPFQRCCSNVSTEALRSPTVSSPSARIVLPAEFLMETVSLLPSQSSLPSHRGGTGSGESCAPSSKSADFWLLEPELRTRTFMHCNNEDFKREEREVRKKDRNGSDF